MSPTMDTFCECCVKYVRLAYNWLTSIDDLVFLTALVGFMLMVVRVFSRLASHTWQTQVDREALRVARNIAGRALLKNSVEVNRRQVNNETLKSNEGIIKRLEGEVTLLQRQFHDALITIRERTKTSENYWMELQMCRMEVSHLNLEIALANDKQRSEQRTHVCTSSKATQASSPPFTAQWQTASPAPSSRTVSSAHSLTSTADYCQSPVQWTSGIPFPTHCALSPSRSITLSSSTSFRARPIRNDSSKSLNTLFPYGYESDPMISLRVHDMPTPSELTIVTDNGLSTETTAGVTDSFSWNCINPGMPQDNVPRTSPSDRSSSRSPNSERHASCDMPDWVPPQPRTSPQLPAPRMTLRPSSQGVNRFVSPGDRTRATPEETPGNDRQRSRHTSAASCRTNGSRLTYEKVRREFQHIPSAEGQGRGDRIVRRARKKLLDDNRTCAKLQSRSVKDNRECVNKDQTSTKNDVFWRLSRPRNLSNNND